MKEKIRKSELVHEKQMDLLVELMNQGDGKKEDFPEEDWEEIPTKEPKKKAGRPKKEESEKSKYFGLWLTKEYQQLIKNLPLGKGLSSKLKKLVDFYYDSLEREKGVQEHLEKLLKSSEEWISKGDGEETRKVLEKILQEWGYLNKVLRLSDRYLLQHLSGVNWKRYQKLMKVKETIWKEASKIPSTPLN